MKILLRSATNRSSRGDAGFTFIDLMMVVLLLTVMAAIVPVVSLPAIQEGRVERTKSKLLSIRKAIIGDPELKVRGARTDFGYVGDMGGLPTSLSDLLTMPLAAGVYEQDSDVRFNYGWNGPYLDTSNPEIDWTKDAWDNNFIYTAGSPGNPTTVISYGADGVVGGSELDADLEMKIPDESTVFTLHGFVTDSGGGVFTGTGEVFLNDLNGDGQMASPVPTPIQSGGYFAFERVSMGRRSIYLTLPSPIPTHTVGPVTVTPGSHHVVLPSRYLEAP